MQIIRLPPGDMSQNIQINNLSALKCIDRELGIDHTDDLSDVWNLGFRLFGEGIRLRKVGGWERLGVTRVFAKAAGVLKLQ